VIIFLTATVTVGSVVQDVGQDEQGKPTSKNSAGTLPLVMWPSEGTKIAFAGRPTPDSANIDIYVSDDHGNRLVRVTDYEGADASPSWSPDGSSLAFVSDRGEAENFDIYILDRSGKVTRLTTDPGTDSHPAWSPDGSQIAFMRNNLGTDDIWTISLQEGREQNLTDNAIVDGHPSWSPGGARIAFARNVDGNVNIFTMNASDGSEVRRLTQGSGTHEFPAWSPDGRQIAYVERGGAGTDRIMVVSADGNENRTLTDDAAGVGDLAWSADSSAIIFSGRPTWSTEGPQNSRKALRLTVIGLDGKVRRSFGIGNGDSFAPSWSGAG
jgi:Tol biopolymer transport system component